MISPSRTFGFEDEVEFLRAQGLIKGGSVDNAIVLSKDGILNDENLRFKNEFAVSSLSQDKKPTSEVRRLISLGKQIHRYK